MDSITADSLTFHIKDALLRLNVQLSQCRGQCYDGASNMSVHYVIPPMWWSH